MGIERGGPSFSEEMDRENNGERPGDPQDGAQEAAPEGSVSADDESGKGKVIEFVRFDEARRMRENQKKIDALKLSFLKHQLMHEETTESLETLLKRYGSGHSYSELGEKIEDDIIDIEVELESLQEKLHSQVQIKKFQKGIDEARKDLERWEAVFSDWEEAGDGLANELRELFVLLGQEAFEEFLSSHGYKVDTAALTDSEMEGEGHDEDEELDGER